MYYITVSCVVVVVVVVVPPTLPPSLSTIADAAADALAIARPRLLQYSDYNFVTQPAARQPSPFSTLECAPYKIIFITFRYICHGTKPSTHHAERRTAPNSPTWRPWPTHNIRMAHDDGVRWRRACSSRRGRYSSLTTATRTRRLGACRCRKRPSVPRALQHSILKFAAQLWICDGAKSAADRAQRSAPKAPA